MAAKKYDDTTLEYYGLTKEDIEEIKKDKDFIDGDIMLDAMKLSGMFYALGYDIEVDDIVSLLEKNKKNEKVQTVIW